jgi:hypothetical protein
MKTVKILLALMLVVQLLMLGVLYHGMYIYTCPCDLESDEGENFTTT